ncbi:MAG TPA: hypothetical protein PK513_01845 [Alphaproteobacteria bacterium]|nr:hypothetical protein [Alphaproteobacteria bacterium]USO05350.1 MAG: hypothetical protein H6859_09405 [Rhodospirillales bacterium]HOO81226.1 hypothetical protein [Alphaproteobacteria bacterium]
MRFELIKFLQQLGVNHALSPYETQPWLVYSEEKKLTCSAEVRMGPTGEDIEAEIQFLHDETDDDDEDGGASSGGGREQILWMRAEPVGENQWGPKHLRIKGKDYVNEFHGWEEKGCEFFLACVSALQMNEIPDIDMLIEDKMKDDSFGGGGRRGKIGRKSPKVKPAALMGMKKP